MRFDAEDFDALVARFGRLGRADRAAILARLDPAGRARVTDAIARHRGAAKGDDAGRRYAAYSPWLATIVRGAGGDESGASAIRDHARAAILEAHAAMTSSGDVAADSLMSQLRRWGARWIDGSGAPR